MRRGALSIATAATAVALVACGADPTAQTGTTDTVAATGGSPSPAAATGDLPSVDHGRARALEALLPSELGGSPVDKQSFSGERLARSPAGEGFVDVLRELGIHPRAASFAFAATDDQDAVGAMRAVGASPQDLVRTFVDSSKEKGAKVSQATVGGKRVTVVSQVKGLPGQEYVYAQGDTVFFVVSADEAVATEALAALP